MAHGPRRPGPAARSALRRGRQGRTGSSRSKPAGTLRSRANSAAAPSRSRAPKGTTSRASSCASRRKTRPVPAVAAVAAGGIQVDAGDNAPAARGSLRGRVFDARTGAPVVAFAIALWRRDGIALSRMLAPASFLDASGAYEITDLDPGTYEATAMAAGYAWSGYAVAQVDTSPVQADFALRAGARIEGIVTEDTTRRPIAGAVISLEGRRAVAPNLPVAPLSPEAETGADGRFTLEQVPPDAMSLHAQKEGYLTRLVTLGPLPEEGDYPPIAIGLTPRASGDDASVELTGIGAVLEARREWLAAVNVVAGGGATDAGLVPGDQILAIDGTPVAGLGYERAIGVIRGPEGTTVVLSVRRDGREIDVVGTRKRVRH